MKSRIDFITESDNHYKEKSTSIWKSANQRCEWNKPTHLSLLLRKKEKVSPWKLVNIYVYVYMCIHATKHLIDRIQEHILSKSTPFRDGPKDRELEEFEIKLQLTL